MPKLKYVFFTIISLCNAGCRESEEQKKGDSQLSESETQVRAETAMPDITVLGFKLGDRVNLPECQTFDDVPETCRSDNWIYLKKSEMPDYFDGNRLMFTEVGGKGLQSISASTKYELAALTDSYLELKYGPPDWQENAQGVETPRTRSWSYSNIFVTFSHFTDASGFTVRTHEQWLLDQKSYEEQDRRENAEKRSL